MPECRKAKGISKMPTPIIVFVIRNAVRTGPFFLTGGPASFSPCASDVAQPLSLPRLPSSPPRIEGSTAAAVIGPSSSSCRAYMNRS